MLIIGAKGFATQLISIISRQFHKNLAFFDNVSNDCPDVLFESYPVLKSFDAVKEGFASGNSDFVLGIGGTKKRADLCRKIESLGGRHVSIIASSAEISPFATHLGTGSCILSQAIVESNVTIGEGCIINNRAIVSHDVNVGAFCEIAPGACILGSATIGDFTLIGAQSTILPNVRIGMGCRIGAGAVVLNDVPDNYTVVGVPAKPLQ